MSSFFRSRSPKPQTSDTSREALPNLLGDGRGLYQARPANFLLSFLLHALAIAVMAGLTAWLMHNHPGLPGKMLDTMNNVPRLIAPDLRDGGGSGGTQDPRPPSLGVLPPFAAVQFTPPLAVLANPAPVLPMQPTLLGPADIKLPQTGTNYGDPLNGVLNSASNGPGSGGGIGTRCCGGVGNGNGRGYGPGDGDGVTTVHGNIIAPHLVYSPDPEYSDEARKARVQGKVTVWLVVGQDGNAHGVRVVRPMGFGLDEKAVQAVSTWRFEPARLDDRPVAVQIMVEVYFRLY